MIFKRPENDVCLCNCCHVTAFVVQVEPEIVDEAQDIKYMVAPHREFPILETSHRLPNHWSTAIMTLAGAVMEVGQKRVVLLPVLVHPSKGALDASGKQ